MTATAGWLLWLGAELGALPCYLAIRREEQRFRRRHPTKGRTT